MKKLLSYLKEIAVAILIGLGAGLISFVVLYLIGICFGGNKNGFIVARSGLLIVGGFFLAFTAVLLIKGGNLPKNAFKLRIKADDASHENDVSNDVFEIKFKKLFVKLNKQYVALFIAVGVLLLAGAADHITWLIK